MRRHLLHLLLIATPLLLASCTGTIASRIKAKEDIFNTYPPEIQQTIREGLISATFTREQVEIALGSPIDSAHPFNTSYGVSQSCTYTIYLPDEKTPSAPRKKHTITISYLNDAVFRATVNK